MQRKKLFNSKVDRKRYTKIEKNFLFEQQTSNLSVRFCNKRRTITVTNSQFIIYFSKSNLKLRKRYQSHNFEKKNRLNMTIFYCTGRNKCKQNAKTINPSSFVISFFTNCHQRKTKFAKRNRSLKRFMKLGLLYLSSYEHF